MTVMQILPYCVQAFIVKLWINSCVSFFDRTGSNPKIRRNKIWGGQNGGILVYNSGEKQSSLVLFDLFFFPPKREINILVDT